MTTARKAPVSGAGLIAEARRLAPLLAEHAPEGERLRRAPDAVIDALREARIFDLMVPEVHGGLGLDADTFLEVGLALAEGDAAMAWLTSFYIEHNWMFCQFPTSFQEKLYASTSHVLAPAVVAPTGKSVEVDGGFRVSGRWQFGTGIEHADDWVILMTLVPADSGPVQLRMCALRRNQVTVEDDWFTDGMRATGSNTIVVEDALIPAEQAILVQPISEGTGAVHDLPLYRTPMQPLIMLAVSMPAVGQARAAVRGFAERARNRSFLGSKTKLAETSAAQMRLARAELEANQAEQLLRSVTTELMALRDNATVADRARMTAMLALAVDQSKRVLRLVHDASGPVHTAPMTRSSAGSAMSRPFRRIRRCPWICGWRPWGGPCSASNRACRSEPRCIGRYTRAGVSTLDTPAPSAGDHPLPVVGKLLFRLVKTFLRMNQNMKLTHGCCHD